MTIRQCALANEAFQTLKHYYEHRMEYIDRCGKKTVAILGWGVPEEMIRAHGMVACPVCADKNSSLHEADTYLEYSFAPKARRWFDAIMGGGGRFHADFIAIADSEDVVNRINYYLREVIREEPDRRMRELYFVDLLFSRHMMYQLWNEKAYCRFEQQLSAWGGQMPEGALERELALSNRIISRLRELSGLRKGDRPRITGTESLIITGSGFYMDKEEYLQLLTTLADEAKSWDEVCGTRVFFSGSAQEDTCVYELIEDSGAVIVGEDHNWGDRYCEKAFREDIPAVRAMVDKYMLTSPTAQKGLVAERVAYIKDAVTASNAEAVLFYNDIYEEAASWDHPSQKSALDAMGIPSVNLCKMPYPPEKSAEVPGLIKNAVIRLKGVRENG